MASQESEQHVYTEKDLPEGYTEENQHGELLRYSTEWTLMEGQKAVSVDKKVGEFSKCTLYGILEPFADTSLPPIRFRVPCNSGTYLSVDTTDENRGMWLAMNDVFHLLKVPSVEQNPKHTQVRARFGLLSNIVDLFTPTSGDVPKHLIEELHDMTPKEVHAHMSCDDKEPFDLKLLLESTDFLQTHLRQFFEGHTSKEFWKGIAKKQKKKTFKEDDYKHSAILAEERSQREPWGRRLKNAKEIDSLWKLRMANNSSQVDASNQAPKKRPHATDKDQTSSTSSSETPGASSKKRRKFDSEEEEEEEDDDDDDMFADASQEEFSEEAMKRALKTFKKYLQSKSPQDVWSSYAVGSEKAGALIKELKESKDRSKEEKLLVVSAFRNACAVDTKAVQELFNKKTGRKNLEDWIDEALKDIDHQDPVRSGSTSALFLGAVSNLVHDFPNLHDAKVLEKLKNCDGGIDLKKVLEKIKQIGEKKSLTAVAKSAIDALNAVRGAKAKQPPPNSEHSKPAAQHKDPATKKAVESKESRALATGTDDAAEKQRRKEEVEDERRRRMNEMVRQKNTALTAATLSTGTNAGVAATSAGLNVAAPNVAPAVAANATARVALPQGDTFAYWIDRDGNRQRSNIRVSADILRLAIENRSPSPVSASPWTWKPSALMKLANDENGGH